MSPLGAGPLEPDSTPAAFAGGAETSGSASSPNSAGPAVSAGHPDFIVLGPTRERPRLLKVIKDPQLKAWWWAHLSSPKGESLGFAGLWEDAPRVVIRPASVVLSMGAHTHFDLAREEVEQLRPLTAHGLVIEETAR